MHKTPKIYTTNYRQWLTRLGYASTTINSYQRMVTEFLDWHIEQGHNLENQTIPVPDLSNLSLKNHLKNSYDILSQTEIKALYSATDNNQRGYQDTAMLSLYYGCGLRRQEGLQLQAADIDWKRNYLHVKEGKGRKNRIIPITKKIASDLQAIIQEDQSRLLPYGRTTILNRLKKLADQAGITKNVTIHGLRHSIATHLLEAGMTLEQISIFLGHSSLETTQIYTRIEAHAWI